MMMRPSIWYLTATYDIIMIIKIYGRMHEIHPCIEFWIKNMGRWGFIILTFFPLFIYVLRLSNIQLSPHELYSYLLIIRCFLSNKPCIFSHDVLLLLTN